MRTYRTKRIIEGEKATRRNYEELKIKYPQANEEMIILVAKGYEWEEKLK